MKYLVGFLIILSGCLFFAYGFAHARMSGASDVNVEALKVMFTASSFLPITLISMLLFVVGVLFIKLQK